MRTTLILFALMFALMLPSICQADNKLLYGLGNNSCSKLIEAFSQQPHDISIKIDGTVWPSQSKAYLAWIQGYISAFNMYNEQGKNLVYTDDDGLAAWMKKYCSDNPLDSVLIATIELISVRTNYDLSKKIKNK